MRLARTRNSLVWLSSDLSPCSSRRRRWYSGQRRGSMGKHNGNKNTERKKQKWRRYKKMEDPPFSPGRAPDPPFSPGRAPDPQFSPGRAPDPQFSPGRAPDPPYSPGRAPDLQLSLVSSLKYFFWGGVVWLQP